MRDDLGASILSRVVEGASSPSVRTQDRAGVYLLRRIQDLAG